MGDLRNDLSVKDLYSEAQKVDGAYLTGYCGETYKMTGETKLVVANYGTDKKFELERIGIDGGQIIFIVA